MIQTMAVVPSARNVSVLTQSTSQTEQCPALNRGPPGSYRTFINMANLATKPSSRDDGLVARLAILTVLVESTLITITLHTYTFCLSGFVLILGSYRLCRL